MKTKEVLEALSNYFTSPEWCFFTEFQSSPGFSGSQRRMDAVAVRVWPSGKLGQCIFGFEVKVSRADFLKDKKDPEKFRQTYAACDRAYYVCPPGVAIVSEVPGWSLGEAGLIIVQKVPGSENLELTFAEGKFEKKEHPVSRDFVSALARKLDPRQYEYKATLQRAAYKRELAEKDREWRNKFYNVKHAKELLLMP